MGPVQRFIVIFAQRFVEIDIFFVFNFGFVSDPDSFLVIHDFPFLNGFFDFFHGGFGVSFSINNGGGFSINDFSVNFSESF